MPLQNTPLGHYDYFELIILRNDGHRRRSENGAEIPLLTGKHTFIKKILFCTGFPFLYQEGGSKSPENLIAWEGSDLVSLNSPYPFTAFPGDLP